MRKQHKHIFSKIIAVLVVAFALFVAFADITPEQKHVEKPLSSNVLKN